MVWQRLTSSTLHTKDVGYAAGWRRRGPIQGYLQIGEVVGH